MKSIKKFSYKFTLVLFYFSLTACRPDSSGTDFNVLVEAPEGRDAAMETDEETDLLIEYSVDPLLESIDLKLWVSEQPKHGKLKNCAQVTPFSIRCTYTPDKDFSGIDTISFMTRDGDVRGDKPSKIEIKVISKPDAPIALDGTLKASSAKSEKFKFPSPLDPDSKGHDFSYVIVNGPTQGVLTNCKKNKCTYKANSLFEGSDSIKYLVIDHTNLSSNIATMNIVVSTKKGKGIESFTQGVTGLTGVDIVWVIDNSGSMKEEQETLASNFEFFIDNFMINGKAKFPFNMGIITTDDFKSSSKSLLEIDDFGVPYNLSSTRAENDYINFKHDFEKAVNVGIKGSSTEKCFESMKHLHKKNKDWFGLDDKMLVYILLTDEAEQSGGKVNTWIESFQKFKGESDKLKIFPIINVESDKAKRFSDTAKITGTKIYDIKTSFHTILDAISLNVSQKLSSFKLRTDIKIIESSIRLSVDGVEVTDFVYQNNTIQLLKTPAPYTTIIVTYEYGEY